MALLRPGDSPKSGRWFELPPDLALKNTSANVDTANKPIQKHHPQPLDCVPLKVNIDQVQMPSLDGLLSRNMSEAELQETVGALAEWVALVQLGSPRISADDDIDSYLCRYSLPGSDTIGKSNLIRLKWHGLISSKWTAQLMMVLL